MNGTYLVTVQEGLHIYCADDYKKYITRKEWGSNPITKKGENTLCQILNYLF